MDCCSAPLPRRWNPPRAQRAGCTDELSDHEVAGVSWPVPEAIEDAGLERRLFPALNQDDAGASSRRRHDLRDATR